MLRELGLPPVDTGSVDWQADWSGHEASNRKGLVHEIPGVAFFSLFITLILTNNESKFIFSKFIQLQFLRVFFSTFAVKSYCILIAFLLYLMLNLTTSR